MKAKQLNSYLSIYKELLQKGDVQIAYAGLVKYLQKLKTSFANDADHAYVVGNVLQGYMDYSYFYLSNDYLKSKKLKLAMVLNHAEVRFELWLLGQTKEVQGKYWNLLKATQWVNAREMPKYSIFETTLLKNPNFDNSDELTAELESQFFRIASEVVASLKQLD